jgi:pectate lyase/plastocyanin
MGLEEYSGIELEAYTIKIAIECSDSGTGPAGDIYIEDIQDWPTQGFSLSDHAHPGVYEPADAGIQSHILNNSIHLSTEKQEYWDAKADISDVDQAETDAKAYTDTEISGLSSVYSTISHTHPGVYEPANSNIQAHIADGNPHVTPEQKTTWDNKASTAYADQAEADAKSYTDSEISDLSAIYSPLSHNHDTEYSPLFVATRFEASTFTLSASDNNKYIKYTGATDIDITVENSLPSGILITISQGGEGIVTLIPGSGVTLSGDTSTTGQHSIVQLIKTADGNFDVMNQNAGDVGNIFIADIQDWPAQSFSLSDHLHPGVYEPANANIQGHISDTSVHVTPANKSTWDGKAEPGYVDQAEADANDYTDAVVAALSTVYEPKDPDIQTHLVNSNVHVTLTNKDDWYAKADTSYVDQAEADAKTYTDSGIAALSSVYSAIDHAHEGTYEPANANIQGHISDTDAHVSTADREAINNVASLGVNEISITESVPFTHQLTVMAVDQTTNLEFTPNTTDAVSGYRTRLVVTGDSSHTVTFSGFNKSGGSFTFDNTKRNSIIFWKEGDEYWYRIYEQVSMSSGGGAPEISDTNKSFPGAVGFGSSDKGAYEQGGDPTIYTVDTLSAASTQTGTNRGSLRWCIEQTGPRIIVFEISGIIDFTTASWRLKIENDYLTIYGQTAPGKGITIRGATFWIEASHILVQHLRILPGEEGALISANDIDTIDIYGAQTGIVIDHCTLGWSVDELSGPYEDANNITYSYCLFKEALDRSTHYELSGGTYWPERHPYGVLCDAYNVTFYRNIFCYTYGRNPLIRNGAVQVINNYIYSTRWVPPMFAGATNIIYADLISNKIERFTSPEWTTHDTIAYVVETLNASSRLYVSGNESQYLIDNPGASQWDAVYGNTNVTQGGSPHTSTSGIDILDVSQVKAHCLENCGAFYWNRDATDADCIAKLQASSGSLRHSATDYPATARNLEGTATSGDMSSGHDWSSGNQTLVLSYNETAEGGIVGPYTYTLTANCANISEVVAHINNLLPSAFLVCEVIGEGANQETDLVCIRTTHAASTSFIEVHSSGTGHGTLGIAAGTFYGQTNISWDTSSETEELTLPATPHADGDSNTYTDIEEWAYEMSYPPSSEESVDSWPFAAVSHAHVMANITDIGSHAGKDFWQGTQTEYNNLGSYDNDTVYYINVT